MNQQPRTSDFESLRDITRRMVAEYREKRQHRTFCEMVDRHERERPVLNLTDQDRTLLRGLRIRA
jgi:hypothetical protein